MQIDNFNHTVGSILNVVEPEKLVTDEELKQAQNHTIAELLEIMNEKEQEK